MPNWCSNIVTFSHKDPAAIKRVVDAWKTGEFMQQFFPCPEELIKAVKGYSSDPKEQAEINAVLNANSAKHGYPTWYEWSLANWGVKWDVAVSDDEKYPDTYMEGPTANGENLVVYYNFNTPWGIAQEALLKLSSQYPTLLFTLSYEEETGWGGEDEFLRGQYIQGASWNWKCKECDYMETGEPPYCEECEYDMCPECGYGEPDEACEIHREKVGA